MLFMLLCACYFYADVSTVPSACPIPWLRAAMALQKVSPPCIATDSRGKADRRVFSLGTGALPISPYECPVHFMELMKSCTDGIHPNKGFYSQGRFLCHIFWAIFQLAQPYQPNASAEPDKFLSRYQTQRCSAPAAVSSVTSLCNAVAPLEI